MRVDESLLRIGEVAERVGLSLRTVRYYEEMGLVAPEKRSEGGFRLYSDEQVNRLRLIKRMKPLDFTVQEMRELLDARDHLRDETASEEVREESRATLTRFAQVAGDRVEDLRRRTSDAESFADEVRRESHGGRRPSVAGKS